MTIALSQSGAFSNSINANSPIYGADSSGTNDSTTALQAAATAAAGKTMFIPAGNYRISAPIVFQSNTRVFGQGLSSRIFTTAGTGFNFFINKNQSLYPTGNYGVALDSLIIIEDMYFDYGSLNDGGTHAVSFRLAQNCFVQRCQFNGGNDATSTLASKNMTVRDCIVTGCTNVGIDSGDGNENLLVENNAITMQTATTAGQNTGIMFTATNTGSNTARTTKGCIARGNKIYNAGVGLFINQLDTLASKTVHCALIDNELYGCLGALYVTGAGYGHQVLNNYIEGGGVGGSLMRLAGEPSTAAPTDCRVQGTVANGFVAIADTGMFNVSGSRHILNDLTLINGSGIPSGVVYYIKTAASGCLIEGGQMLDPSSIAAIQFGLFVGNNSSPADTNCSIHCFDGYAGAYRNQGA